jgi:hypothetical protein
MLAYSFLTFILATISVSAQAQNARVVYVDSLFHDILLSCNADIILAQISQYFLVLTGDALLVRYPFRHRSAHLLPLVMSSSSIVR